MYPERLSILKVRRTSTRFDKNSPEDDGLHPHSLTSHSKVHGVECASYICQNAHQECISQHPSGTSLQKKKALFYLRIITIMREGNPYLSNVYNTEALNIVEAIVVE